MYTNRLILKLNCTNPNLQRVTVLNVWSPSRNINFLQKCKDCLNSVLRNPQQRGEVCKVSESCCSAREDASSHEAPVISASKPQYSANVVIIGAGMAGLSAANHLQDNGVTNITVLEALDRPGGRVKSRWFGDVSIELGPFSSTISAKKNPIAETMFRDGLAPYPANNADFSRGLLARSDGTPIPYPISVEVYERFKQILEEVKTMDEQGGLGRNSPQTLVGGRIEQEIRMFSSRQQVDVERAFHGMASMVFNKSNRDTSMMKSTQFGDYIQLPGSCVQVPIGHFGEINTLYESLDAEKILFNKTVSKIRWGGVADVFPKAVVICEDGQSFLADYVIITIPLGVLKATAESLFCPGLPASKLDAILKIPVGFTNKIFLEFSEPFWKWNKNFRRTEFDADEMQCKEGWLKGAKSLEPISGSNHVMCLTIAGPQAQCLESLTDEEIVCGTISLLKETSKVSKVPEPKEIKRTSWSCDPNFYGAFSCKGPKVSSKDFYSLATPLPEHSDFCDPVLLFAGEATCPVNFGSLKGAKNSGIREAERLLQLIRLQNDQSENQEDFEFEPEQKVMKCN